MSASRVILWLPVPRVTGLSRSSSSPRSTEGPVLKLCWPPPWTRAGSDRRRWPRVAVASGPACWPRT
jgi:hypothetical protein